MLCKNCGASIRDNLAKCPYCQMSLKDIQSSREKDDENLENRFIQIDDLFGFKVNYTILDNSELANFYNKIFENFEKIDLDNNLFKENLGKIINQVESVEEEFQSRFPIREDAIKELPKCNADIVIDLLENYNPPEVNAAAYKIRALTERQLKDFYHFEYGKWPTSDPKQTRHGFKDKYFDMFMKVTNDNAVSFELNRIHSILNNFVHEGKENDEFLEKKFPTKEKQVDFLLKSYELFKKYNLA